MTKSERQAGLERVRAAMLRAADRGSDLAVLMVEDANIMNAARARTGDDLLGWRVSGGLMQVIRSLPTGKGTCTVEPVSTWMARADAQAFVSAMAA